VNAPSQTSKSITLVITDPLNQKMEHQTIKWENLSFLASWVIDTPRAPIPHSITFANIQESPSSAIITFPTSQHSYPKDDHPSDSTIPTPSLCLHPSLQSLASSLGRIPYSIQCLDYAKLVIFSTLPSCTKNNQIHPEHSHHNPRKNLPPTSSTSK